MSKNPTANLYIRNKTNKKSNLRYTNTLDSKANVSNPYNFSSTRYIKVKEIKEKFNRKQSLKKNLNNLFQSNVDESSP